ncbi:MAG: phenylacetate-CoA oxygenase subunit PaaJ [Sphingomonadaceae bacterium]|nr:phenylacetate-CoA oxygenase subunit PaaJ [Sphingomonadaceae bacterium]
MAAAPLAIDLEARVMAVLEGVPDPEIPAISIVDLGIVRGVRAHPPAVMVTPTYTGCPATRVIEQSIRAALDESGLGDVAIETVLSPPWTTDWISERGRARLEAYGIAPPSLEATAVCPQCGSSETVEVSRFGSTPCKALWRCETCREPFDRFKCH